ncbi:MAG: hypothetical protein IPM32_01070 [Ignavibacteriae bacterium]|nr:hypothetical protein [Ignavibacteriota bacterium]
MKNQIIFIFNFILLFVININAQIIKADSALTPINIGDSAAHVDSLSHSKIVNKFFLRNSFDSQENIISSYVKSKQEIDFENYRTASDFLNFLPFTFQKYFGIAGSPNVPNLFFLENKNISFVQNNFSLSNSWNGSSDLNLISSENVNDIEIIPLSRSFLYNNYNSPAVIRISAQDSITEKPVSRIRYYQAPDDDASIDAMFGALIYKDLHLSFRLSNSAYTGFNDNSEYGVWKSDLKSIYRIADSLFLKLNYYHLKSNLQLNGGVDVETLFANNVILEDEIFNTIAPVNFVNRYKETTINKVSSDFYGIILPNSSSKLNLEYNYSYERLRQNIDITYPDSIQISSLNKFSTYNIAFHHLHSINNLSLKFNFDYNFTNYSIEYYNIYENKNSYSYSALIDYKIFDSTIIPSLFFKSGSYENQLTNGFGSDVKLSINKNLKFMLGFSKFNQPYLISELFSLPKSEQEKNYVTNYFLSSEISFDNFITSISYFNISSDNTPVPVFNNNDLNLNSTKIIFPFTEEVKTEGINFFSTVKLWSFEFFINSNFLLSNKSNYITKPNKFNLFSGVYYRDKLYNDNLDLKMGFNLFLSDNNEYQLFDFQIMRSTSYYLNNSILTQFKNYKVSNTPFRIDFTLAGRIQDRATFYFAYENILGNNYYSIPFYPMPDGGIKIGISWDFIE